MKEEHSELFNKDAGFSGGVFGEFTDTDKEDSAWDAVIYFEENYSSKELWEEYQKLGVVEPEDLFEQHILERLKSFSSGKRLVFLAWASRSLMVTPSLASRYFELFPEDVLAIVNMFKERNGSPHTGYEHYLFVLIGDRLPSLNIDRPGIEYRLEDYKAIAERKNKAPEFLLDGKVAGTKQNPDEFGKAGEDFNKALKEASKLMVSGEYYIDASSLFSDGYKNLTEEDKASFLQLCLKQFQSDFVFEEVYNSRFTKEKVEDQRSGYAREDLSKRAYRHNPQHSLLFRTFQPLTALNYNQGYYDYEMNSSVEVGGFVEEYPYHRLTLETLKHFAELTVNKDSSIDLLVEFWDKNRNPIFGNAVVEALSSLGPNRASSKLLEAMSRETRDKHMFSGLLYRMEFGQIGISEEGVKYLERMYDLGEYNNSEYLVNRLTADGQIGIFDEKRKLIKYFELGDISDDQRHVRASVLDFTYETLFLPKPNESENDRRIREKILEEFKEHYFDLYNQNFFDDTQIHFNNLSFREQGWFLHFMKNSDSELQARAKEFIARYGESGFRTFLSLDQGEENGNMVLEIGEYLPREAAEAIFKKYGEIIDLIKEVGLQVSDYFKNNKRSIKQAEATQIEINLLKKGQKLLHDFSIIALQLKDDSMGGKIATDEILERLARVKVEALLFGAIFKGITTVAQNEGQTLDLTEVKSLVIEQKFNNELAKDQKTVAAMEEIIRTNYSASGYPPRFIEAVVTSFQKALHNGHAQFYILRHNNNIVGFNRFDSINNSDELYYQYFGSFNISTEYQNSKIGDAFMEATVGYERGLAQLFADCDPRAPITTKYIESGFVAFEDYYLEGVHSLKIYSDSFELRNLKSKKLTKQEIISNASEDGLVEFPGLEDVWIDSHPEGQFPTFELLEQGFVMTRYFRDPQNGFLYSVYERFTIPDLKIDPEEKAIEGL